MRVRSSLRALGVFLVVTVLAACGGGSAPVAPPSDAIVVSVGISEPKRLIPSAANEWGGNQVTRALYAPLVEYDATFRPYELAAASVTSSDNTVWTIRLRPGWTFHNGEPVTADSYINAWNAGAYGPNAHDANYLFDKIRGYADLNPTDGKTAPKAKKLSGLAKKDDLTFEVTLSAPYASFKSMLGYGAFYPVPLAAFTDVASNVYSPAFEQAPIGQGPFKMKGKWQHDQSIEVERFDHYQGPVKPKIAGAEFKIYLQIPTQYQDLLAGQLDIVPRLPIESLGNARADLGDRFGQSPNSSAMFLAFPTFDARYGKVEIRRAISMAIDREEILRTIFHDSYRPLRSYVSDVVPGHRPDSCGEACQYNPAKAKTLFDSVGGARVVGGKIELAYNVDGGHKPWIDAACNQIRKNLGVDCVGNPQPKFAELLTKLERKERIGAFRYTWGFDYPAMENYLAPLFTARSISNYTGYANPAFESLLAAGDRAPNLDAAIGYYQQAEDLLGRDLPMIPMFLARNNFGYSTRVQHVEIDLYERANLMTVEAAVAR